MSVQTSYTTSHSAAYAGMIADLQPHDIVSKVCETAAGIAFGVVVSPGTSDNEAIIGGDATGIGITVRDLAREGAASTAATAYARYETMGVMRKGYMWVVIANTGTPGQNLFYTDATGLISQGTASTGETQLTGCTLESTVSSNGDLGLIRVDL